MRDSGTGVCGECQSPPEAYHREDCSQFKGYHCWECGGIYHGEYCPTCPPPFWAINTNTETLGQP